MLMLMRTLASIRQHQRRQRWPAIHLVILALSAIISGVSCALLAPAPTCLALAEPAVARGAACGLEVADEAGEIGHRERGRRVGKV